jgi:hypothetical protein
MQATKESLWTANWKEKLNNVRVEAKFAEPCQRSQTRQLTNESIWQYIFHGTNLIKEKTNFNIRMRRLNAFYGKSKYLKTILGGFFKSVARCDWTKRWKFYRHVDWEFGCALLGNPTKGKTFIVVVEMKRKFFTLAQLKIQKENRNRVGVCWDKTVRIVRSYE